MEVTDTIRSRRSIRKFQDKPVSWDEIVKILQSAKYAPCAGNIFNLKLIVVKNEAKRNAIAEACMQQYWMALAPIHIAVIGEPEKAERYYGVRGARLYTIQLAGAAIQNMLLTARSLGLGGCWIGAFDEEEIRSLCGLPEHVNVQAIVTIGYADEQPEMPPKYRIEHIMFFEKWWGRIEPPKTGLGYWGPSTEKLIKETAKAVKKKGKRIAEGIKERLKRKGYK